VTVEYIRYRIPLATAAEFEAAYRRAALALRSTPYCRSFDLSRCEESPESYVLRIVWTSTEDHLQRFRGSEQFQRFLAEIRSYVPAIEEMQHYTPVPLVPSLFEWAGGAEALVRLFERFYDTVTDDELLGPVFAGMSPDHPRHVAAWLGEVFGGPRSYTERGGTHRTMIGHHLGRELTQSQRRRWFDLLLDAADDVGLPADPEFRSAFVGYLEWGTRLAVQFSQPGLSVDVPEPMPQWGWGELRPWV
jgi:hemoglobin